MSRHVARTGIAIGSCEGTATCGERFARHPSKDRSRGASHQRFWLQTKKDAPLMAARLRGCLVFRRERARLRSALHDAAADDVRDGFAAGLFALFAPALAGA